VKSRAVRAKVGALCREARDHADVLVEAFAIPGPLVPELGFDEGA
jgi:hypothetical protein